MRKKFSLATTIPNPDISDQVNTIVKIAKKRAFKDATLLAVNASEFFSQDLEDFAEAEVPDNNVQAGGEEDISKEPDEILSEPSTEQLLSVLRVLFERLNLKKYAVAYTRYKYYIPPCVSVFQNRHDYDFSYS